MYYPWTWHASNTPSPRKSPRNFKFELEAPVPHKHCKEDSTTQQKYNGKCRTWMGLSEWYTNNTHIPGDPTLPEDMYDYRRWVINLSSTIFYFSCAQIITTSRVNC